jgi:tRNA splicing endonuclease
MNAQQARELAHKKNENLDVTVLVAFVKKKIEAAANKGELSIKDPLKGIRTPVSAAQKRAVYAALRGQGYTVASGMDAKHLDHRARQEDEVSW